MNKHSALNFVYENRLIVMAKSMSQCPERRGVQQLETLIKKQRLGNQNNSHLDQRQEMQFLL